MPRPKEFTVRLKAADRAKLTKVVSSGTHPARMITRARVLLALDESQGDAAGAAPTPKHGRWRGIAEIELSCLTRQCLGRRIADIDVLNAELEAWTHATNSDERQVDWQFTTSNARIKLRHPYPAL